MKRYEPVPAERIRRFRLSLGGLPTVDELVARFGPPVEELGPSEWTAETAGEPAETIRHTRSLVFRDVTPLIKTMVVHICADGRFDWEFRGKELSTFRAARGFAIFLSIGGVFWALLFLFLGYVTAENWGNFVGIAIVGLWLCRAFNVGSKSVWIITWVLSICWHLLWSLAGFGLAVVGVGTFGSPALAFALFPVLWVVTACVCSVSALVSELQD